MEAKTAGVRRLRYRLSTDFETKLSYHINYDRLCMEERAPLFEVLMDGTVELKISLYLLHTLLNQTGSCSSLCSLKMSVKFEDRHLRQGHSK